MNNVNDNDNSLRIIPLGGLGEIGLNMTVFEAGGDIMIVDAGLMFPEDHMLGIDYVIPEAGYVMERKDMVRGIVLTHGHEDHIGALPYIIEELGCPIWGTRLTLGLLKQKLKEHKLDETTDLKLIKPGDTVTLGCFKAEAIRVTHSIVDGIGLAIDTPAGVVLHTGDFKIDPTPVDGGPTDLNRFAAYGNEGVLLLMSDSTNIEKEGYTLSEREVGKAFVRIFEDAPGRIIIASFASNIHRIQQAIDVADKFHRKVILNGRSMVQNARIAAELGYLHPPEGILVDMKEIKNLYPEQVCIITTGSQGEPLSALSRMAFGDHKQVKIGPGDTVILSSKFIPGNETAIHKIINHLYKRGAEVHYEKVSEIHVSGHASREELGLMIQLAKPTYFMPIHGETRHLVQHAKLANSLGIPPEKTILAHDGDVVAFDSEGGHIVDKVNVGRILVDGKGVGDVGDVVLRDRRNLSANGMVIAIIGIKAHTGEVIYGPDITTRGLTFEEESGELIEQARQAVSDTINELPMDVKADISEMKAEVGRTLRRFFNKQLDRRPVIMPLIIEL